SCSSAIPTATAGPSSRCLLGPEALAPEAMSLPAAAGLTSQRAEEDDMGKIIAGITTSVDGYITGLGDGPGCGLGVGGERLHYWVFGGPWSYDAEPTGQALPEDQAWLEDMMGRLGAVVGGRSTYEAADHWG